MGARGPPVAGFHGAPAGRLLITAGVTVTLLRELQPGKETLPWHPQAGAGVVVLPCSSGRTSGQNGWSNYDSLKVASVDYLERVIVSSVAPLWTHCYCVHWRHLVDEKKNCARPLLLFNMGCELHFQA